MTTFRCPSDILITSWLYTARYSTWPGNHLVPCVAELVGFWVPIHTHRCLPDPKCLLGSLIHLVCRCASLSTTFALSQSMTWFSSTAWSVMANLWVILFWLALEARVSVPSVKYERVHFFLVFLDPHLVFTSSKSDHFVRRRDPSTDSQNHRVTRYKTVLLCQQSGAGN